MQTLYGRYFGHFFSALLAGIDRCTFQDDVIQAGLRIVVILLCSFHLMATHRALNHFFIPQNTVIKTLLFSSGKIFIITFIGPASIPFPSIEYFHSPVFRSYSVWVTIPLLRAANTSCMYIFRSVSRFL